MIKGHENKFIHDRFGEIRMVETETGMLYFFVADVCEILGISNPSQVLARLDRDEKQTVSALDANGRKHTYSVVLESGLYSLILGSRKRVAKGFKRWVTHEVIPSIRKNGGYIDGQETLTAEQQADLFKQIAELKEQAVKLTDENQRLLVENNNLAVELDEETDRANRLQEELELQYFHDYTSVFGEELDDSAASSF